MWMEDAAGGNLWVDWWFYAAKSLLMSTGGKAEIQLLFFAGART